jgi:colanic acid/amylovoran biosynthesis glycosyltransferase
MSRIYVLFEYPQLSQTFVRNEIQGLRELGVEVDVLTVAQGDFAHIDADWPGEFRVLDRPGFWRALSDHIWFTLRRPTSYRRFLMAVARLRDHWRLALQRLPTEARQLLSKPAPQGTHTHFAWSTASVAAYLARLLEVPASITVHANDIYVERGARLRLRLQHFDQVVTVCNFNVGMLSGLGMTPLGGGDVDVVPCGVTIPDELAAGPASRSAELVSVGRLVEKKGFDTLIRAIALVRRCLPEIHAIIVGDGPEGLALSRLVVELGLERNVTLAGAMSHEATLELIRGAKVFCLASQPARDGDCDALPVVIREAMARAIPVISTRVAGIPETVDDEVGWLVDPRSPEQLAEAITVALHDDEEGIRRGRVGRDRVLRRWTVAAQAAGMVRVFERGDGRDRSMSSANAGSGSVSRYRSALR